MPTDSPTGAGDRPDKPTLRQLLHAATGDRDAEAEALADRTGDDTDEEEAEIAVRRAHGDIAGDDDPTTPDVASPADAEGVREEQEEQSAERR
jgi:hypothetical protein